MAKSVQARAAAEIKKKLKAAGIQAQVSSFQASMCDGVRVYCNEADQGRWEEIEEIAKPYQYGHFNGMEDMYEISNVIDQLPQVMFVHVSYCG
jgi:hypothetical protein